MECELMGQMTRDISPSVAAVTLAFVVETDGREEPLPSGQNDCGRHRRCFLYGGVAKNPPKVNTHGKTGNGRMMGDSCHPGVFCFFFFSLGCGMLRSQNGWGILYTVPSTTQEQLSGFLPSYLTEGTSSVCYLMVLLGCNL